MTMKITLGKLKHVIKEALGKDIPAIQQSSLNWDFFVKMTARIIQQEPDATPSDIANDVFRPSDDEEIREMLAAMRNNDPQLADTITRVAAELGVDEKALSEYFTNGLDATEEYMDDEDEDEEDDDYR